MGGREEVSKRNGKMSDRRVERYRVLSIKGYRSDEEKYANTQYILILNCKVADIPYR